MKDFDWPDWVNCWTLRLPDVHEVLEDPVAKFTLTEVPVGVVAFQWTVAATTLVVPPVYW